MNDQPTDVDPMRALFVAATTDVRAGNDATRAAGLASLLVMLIGLVAIAGAVVAAVVAFAIALAPTIGFVLLPFG